MRAINEHQFHRAIAINIRRPAPGGRKPAVALTDKVIGSNKPVGIID